MIDDYFEKENKNNSNLFLRIAKAVFKGLLYISGIYISKDEDGFRLIAFFRRNK